MLIEQPEESGPGDLFGALLRRRVEASSKLYQSMDMSLTLPLLEEPRDIFQCQYYKQEDTEEEKKDDFERVEIDKERSEESGARSAVTAETFVFSVKSGALNRSDGLIDSVNEKQTDILCCRRYLTMSLKEDFLYALYNKSFLAERNLLWPEASCCVACLQALRGITSRIFNTKIRKPADVVVAGYTIGAMRNYMFHFYEMHCYRIAITKILEMLVASTDPATLAFCHALFDLLYIIDLSNFKMEKKYQEKCTNSLSLVTLVGDVTPACTALVHIFKILSALYSDSNEKNDEGYFSGCDCAEKLLRDYCNSHQPESWDLLNKIVKILESTRTCISFSSFLVHGGGTLRKEAHVKANDMDLFSSIKGTRSFSAADVLNHSTSMGETVSASYIRLCTSSFIVRRVSLPILHAVDETLFQLNLSNCVQNKVESIHATSSPPHNNSDGPLEKIKLSFEWTSSQIEEAKAHGVSLRLFLPDMASDYVDGLCCNDDTVPCLVFPLHPFDEAANSVKYNIASRRIADISKEVNTILTLWLDNTSQPDYKPKSADGGILAQSTEKQESTAMDETIKNENFDIKETGEDHFHFPEQHVSSISKEENIMEQNDSLARVDTPVQIDGITGSIHTTKERYDEAKMQTIEKYATLLKEADARDSLAEWRVQNAKSLAKRRNMLKDLLNLDSTVLHEAASDSDLKDIEHYTIMLRKKLELAAPNSPKSKTNKTLPHKSGGGDGDETPTRIRQQQEPGGTTTLSLSHEGGGGDGDETPTRIRQQQEPGGTTTLSLSHEGGGGDGDETPTRIRQQQEPGGTTTLSLSHEGGGGDGDETPTRIRQQQEPGGTTTLSLSHEGGGGDGDETPTRIRQQQEPGGTTTLSLSHEGGGWDGDETPTRIRQQQEPGGTTTLSLSHEGGGWDGDETPTRIRQQQEPGGTTTLSLSHEGGGGDGDETPTRIRQQQEPGGTTTLSLSHEGSGGDGDETPTRIRQQQEPGGTTTLSLSHEGSGGDGDETPTRIRQQQEPGGTTTLSLSHEGGGGDGDETPTRIRQQQEPGGTTTLSLSHEGGGGDGDETPTRIRQQQEPGGTTTLSLSHEGSGGDGDETPTRIRQQQEPGGTTTLSLSHEGSGGDGDETPTRIRQQQEPGGTTTLSLSHEGSGGDGDETPTRIRQQQEPGGTTTLSLSHEGGGGDGDETPIRIRQQQEPGGTTTLSLSHEGGGGDGDETPTRIRQQQEPGGTTTLSLSHEGGGGDETPTRIRQQQEPGGTTTLSLSHEGSGGDGDETLTRIRQQQEPGGTTTLSLSHEGGGGDGDETPTRIRQQQEPGGTTTLSLSHEGGGGDGDETPTRIRQQQEPGGTTTLSLSHEGGGGDGDETPTRIRQQQEPGGTTTLSLSHEGSGGDGDETLTRIRQQQEPGGTTTLSLSHEGGGGDGDETPIRIRQQQEPGGTTTLSLSHEGSGGDGDDVLLGGCDNVSKVYLGEDGVFLQVADEEEVSTKVLQAEADLTAVNASFERALHNLCLRNGIPVYNYRETDENDIEHSASWLYFYLSDLTPLKSLVQNSLERAVLNQSKAIDHAFFLVSLRDRNLLQHIDFVQSVFLLSNESDFLLHMGSLLVDRHLDRNEMLKLRSLSYHFPFRGDNCPENYNNKQSDRFDFNLYSNHSVSSAYKEALSVFQPNDINVCCNPILFIDDAPALICVDDRADHPNMLLRSESCGERHLIGAFSATGLDGLHLSYDAPWPINLIFSDEYLSMLSLVTQRLLSITQLIALSRHVWGRLSYCRLQTRKNRGVDKYLERYMHSSFCLIRQSFQAISNFTSDRLRLLHMSLKEDLRMAYRNGGGGFSHVAGLVQKYMRNVINAALVPVSKEHLQKNSHALLSDSIEALLSHSRQSLYALHKLANSLTNKGECGQDATIELSHKIESLKQSIHFVRECGEEMDLSSNRNVQSLLIHLESCENF